MLGPHRLAALSHGVLAGPSAVRHVDNSIAVIKVSGSHKVPLVGESDDSAGLIRFTYLVMRNTADINQLNRRPLFSNHI